MLLLFLCLDMKSLVPEQEALTLGLLKLIGMYAELNFNVIFLQMAGNPDQQEDNVDEQYQEEGEEEVRKQK